MVQDAPIHPSKYSTSAADCGDVASMVNRNTDWAGTETERGGFSPFAPSSVTRAWTAESPGLTSDSRAVHPAPPPCGQNHDPEETADGAAVSAARGCTEAGWSRSAPATNAPIAPRASRARALTAARASW